jgi:hypothetical protein
VSTSLLPDPAPASSQSDRRGPPRAWDEIELIVWAAVGQGFEDRPEPRIAFARALQSKRAQLLRELLLPGSYTDAWLLDSAEHGLERLRGRGRTDGGAGIPGAIPAPRAGA